jgi:hypothetical protein
MSRLDTEIHQGRVDPGPGGPFIYETMKDNERCLWTMRDTQYQGPGGQPKTMKDFSRH